MNFAEQFNQLMALRDQAKFLENRFDRGESVSDEFISLDQELEGIILAGKGHADSEELARKWTNVVEEINDISQRCGTPESEDDLELNLGY